MTQTKYTDGSGVAEIWTNTKNYIASQLLGKSNVGHTHSASDITSGLATVATSGSYNDLSNKPTIPTVNNATLTIQKNGTTVKTFTANSSSNVTANITVPTKTSDLTNDSGFLTSHQDLSGYIPKAGGPVLTATSIGRVDNTQGLDVYGGTSFENGGFIALRGKDTNVTGQKGAVVIGTNNGSSNCDLILYPNATLTWGSKNVAMQEDVVPRSGGAVMTSNRLGRVDFNGELALCGGMDLDYGSAVCVFGKSYPNFGLSGAIRLIANDGSNIHNMYMYPSGTWLWEGQAVQLISDQRYKQQIATIDDNLLDAWQDVDLVQFKYNDAVEQKGDKARLHTGYVVQQIDSACKSHGVDVSKYGLYCHEEYPQETEEVEIEQADGTKVKETKVIREASEHYSLRYTEALIVECAYLRKCIKELRNEIEELKSSN